MSELKPCPFCGGKAKLRETTYGNNCDAYVIWCGNRDCEVSPYRLPVKDMVAKLINEIVEITRKQIVDAPTVDAVEVVHGKWEMGVDEGDYDYGTCSVCGYNEYNAFCCLLPHNYCPNCGAKMDGGNEDG